MLTDAKPAQSPDAFAVAKDKLRLGPVPDWATPCQPDYAFTPKNLKSPPHSTTLLCNMQVHVESNATHVHMAVRLENMQAVQQESQWRLEFEPRTQTVTLHWIKVRRGDTETDHTDIAKIHFLQREAGLEGCVIDGLFTALMVLEDVRPGDILEWSYTIVTTPRLLPENRFALFRLPPAIAVGKLFYGVRFNEARPLKCKTSTPDLKFDETRENGEIIWRCARDNFATPEPELGVPSWFPIFSWIQLSDCPDWGVVARAVTDTWEQIPDDSSVAAIAEEISTKETEPLARIEKALRLVQDEFRYLSINLEHGGQIPTPPDTVARRRFGDCKDLSVLLTRVFRRLGIPAYPVLVNSALRRTIGDFLPSPNLFDHVVVQYEFEGETRWVDVTIKNQGGGPLKRALPNFGWGLVLSADTTQLTKPPVASVAPGALRIRESVLLDTTGQGSAVAIVATAEGFEAEILRDQFAKMPLDEIARQRLQICANRYRFAKRLGELKYRDDRETNEFHVAEVFEVNGFLLPAPEPGFCDFPLPANLVNGSLRLPEGRTRRDPFALPQPCTLTHIYEVQTAGFQQTHAPRGRIESPLMRFSRQVRAMPGSWSVTLTLDVLDDVMMGNQFDDHSRRVQQIWQESTWTLTIPTGHAGARPNRAFGILPSPRRPVSATKAPARPTTGTTPANVTPAIPKLVPSGDTAAISKPAEPRPQPPASGESSSRRRRSRQPKPQMGSGLNQWVIVAIVLGAIVLFFTALILVSRAAR